MRILFLITARGGSRGVPGKNIRKLSGISLVGFKAISARRSKYCTRLMISTDSQEIQDDAREYGVEVPFVRPAELATDTATSVDVVLHAMQWIEDHTDETYDAVMLLEPASPFARGFDYDKAVEMMIERDANVVVSVKPTEVNSMFVGALDAAGRMSVVIDKMSEWHAARRQDLTQEYTMNAALYLFRWDFFKANRRIYCDRENTYGYVMEPEYSIEIDTMTEWHRVEFLVEKGYIDLSHWKSGP